MKDPFKYAPTHEEKREALAAYAHQAWSGWMAYLFEKSTANPDGTVTIPAWAVERWRRQVATDYADLSDDEKNSDRAEADTILSTLRYVPTASTTEINEALDTIKAAVGRINYVKYIYLSNDTVSVIVGTQGGERHGKGVDPAAALRALADEVRH